MRLHALQYLRAVAALAVVYSHAVIQVDGYEQYLGHAGSFGVDVFFVISGFIMIYIAKPTNTFGKFIVNRVRRVIPLYWFFTFLMAVILLSLPSVFKATQYDTIALILSLGFIPHWSMVNTTEAWPIVAPGWSLNFEMYFYFIFALSLFFAEKFRIAFITLIISAMFLVAQFFNNGESALAYFFAKSMVFEFVLGMLLAAAWKRGFRLSSLVSWVMLIMATVMLFLHLPIPRIFEFGVPSLLIVMACLFINVKEWRLGVLLGDASYALYLSHIFTLGVLRKVLPPLLGDGQIAAYLFVIISLIVCTVASVFIHKYVDNWLLVQQRLPKFGKKAGAQSKM
ncbi:MAG: exopolysaccharide production protein ExoZ [Gammaproteobacteria bacterium]|jgi:exopolysaccharide production protein ExoZ